MLGLLARRRDEYVRISECDAPKDDVIGASVAVTALMRLHQRWIQEAGGQSPRSGGFESVRGGSGCALKRVLKSPLLS